MVCTGGEPLLQLDATLIDALHARGFEIAVETNGTIAAPAGIDWLCVSPKAGAELMQRSGRRAEAGLSAAGSRAGGVRIALLPAFFLAADGRAEREANTELALRYCLDHPQWRLSLQTHKILGIP